MSPAAAEELMHCFHASAVEARHIVPGAQAFNAEAFQRSLWRHRAEIIHLLLERPAMDDMVEDLLKALRPFGRVAEILKSGENPVLFSIPAAGGRHFVQLRPSDFRLAAELVRMPQ